MIFIRVWYEKRDLRRIVPWIFCHNILDQLELDVNALADLSGPGYLIS